MTGASRIMEGTSDVMDWGLHLSRTAVWVLAAAWCLLTAVRLIALARARSLRSLDAGPRRPLPAAAVLASLGLAAGLAAARPDERFLVNRGGLAAERRDCAAVIRYLEPVARWGSRRPEVYENLGRCYLEAGRYQESIATLHRAWLIAPTPESLLFSAAARLALGQTVGAREDLAAAIPIARSPEQRSAIVSELARIAN